MNEQTQIETCNSLIQDALRHADAFDRSKINLLASLARTEAKIGCTSQPDIIATDEGDLPRNLAAIAKAIRLAGEYPYYVAEVMAVWFAAQAGEVAEFIATNGIKAAVSNFCGIQYERELIQMVAAFFKALPSLGVDNADKVELMKEAYRQGDHYEKIYRGCAQCHMAAVSDVTGKEDKVMFRAANGFAAGMGLLGDGVCGGYSGGILSLGLFAGRRKEFFDGDKQEKEIITKLVAKLHDKYIDTYGSLICHDIHQDIFGRAFHIKEPADKEAFELAGAHTLDKCPAVVGTSAAWVVEILYDEGFMSGKAEAGK